MQKKESFPKSKIKVLLLENIHPLAVQVLQEEGYQVETYKEALDEAELIEKIKDIHILGIRSKTTVSERVLQAGEKLLSVGVFCIGTNQIDLTSCSNAGIVAFNAPYSNTRSVVEMAVGEMIMLMRNIITKNNLMHAGTWDKTATNSVEIRGKKLGLIGYGNIGSQFSVIAEALGMQVYFYDVVDKLALGNATKCKTLEELLQLADVISLHVDGRKSNTIMIGEKEFSQMKKNVIFLNLSRGHVIDITALKNALHSGKVWGAAIDVYPKEPKSNTEQFHSELQHVPNTILTPHIGGSTEEAQANIGDFVSNKILQYINKGDTYGSVNFPEVQLPSFENSHRLLHIHENVPGILAKINAVYAKYNINIQAQYLKTTEEVGYVITDISQDYSVESLEEIKNIPHTIRFRILY
jgi:D-3-phosphoglycerate dehydrogenase